MPSRPPSGLQPSAATGPRPPGRRFVTFRGGSRSQISTPTSRDSSATASCFPSGRIASGSGWNPTEKRAISRPAATSATTTVRSARPTAIRRESAANSAWRTRPGNFQTTPPPSTSRTCRPSGSTMASDRPSGLSRNSSGVPPSLASRAIGPAWPIVCTEAMPCRSTSAYRRNIPSKTGELAPGGTSIASFPAGGRPGPGRRSPRRAARRSPIAAHPPPRDRDGLPQRFQPVEPTARSPAEPSRLARHQVRPPEFVLRIAPLRGPFVPSRLAGPPQLGVQPGRPGRPEHHQRRDERGGHRERGGQPPVPAAESPGMLPGRRPPRLDRPVGKETPKILRQGRCTRIPAPRLLRHRFQDDRLQVARGSSDRPGGAGAVRRGGSAPSAGPGRSRRTPSARSASRRASAPARRRRYGGRPGRRSAPGPCTAACRRCPPGWSALPSRPPSPARSR